MSTKYLVHGYTEKQAKVFDTIIEMRLQHNKVVAMAIPDVVARPQEIKSIVEWDAYVETIERQAVALRAKDEAFDLLRRELGLLVKKFYNAQLPAGVWFTYNPSGVVYKIRLYNDRFELMVGDVGPKAYNSVHLLPTPIFEIE